MCFISIIHVFQVYNIKHAPHVYNNLKKIEYIKNIKFDSFLKKRDLVCINLWVSLLDSSTFKRQVELEPFSGKNFHFFIRYDILLTCANAE